MRRYEKGFKITNTKLEYQLTLKQGLGKLFMCRSSFVGYSLIKAIWSYFSQIQQYWVVLDEYIQGKGRRSIRSVLSFKTRMIKDLIWEQCQLSVSISVQEEQWWSHRGHCYEPAWREACSTSAQMLLAGPVTWTHLAEREATKPSIATCGSQMHVGWGLRVAEVCFCSVLCYVTNI